jgi:multiple sugar transport system substrate-binding protein
MKHAKKSLSSLLIMVSFAATLAACSSGEKPAVKEEGIGAKASGKPVQLTMVESLTSPKRTELLKKMIGDFEQKNPGIKVELISPPLESADNKISTMLAAKQDLDVLEVRDITVQQFVNNKYLESLNTYTSSWKDYETVNQNSKKMATDINKTAYYIPYGLYQRQLFYRKDLFDAKGLKPPTTWEELYTTGKQLTDQAQNKYGYTFRGGPGADQYISQIIQDYNGDKVNPDDAMFNQDGKTIFSTPGALDAINLYQKIYKETSPPDSASWGFSEQVQAFASGTTAMLIQDPDSIDAIKSKLQDGVWATAPLPKGPTGISHFNVGAAGWGMTAYSNHKAEAWKLIEFLSSPEQNLTFAKNVGTIPIHTTATNDEFFKTGPYAPYIQMNLSPDKFIAVKPSTSYKNYQKFYKMGTEQGQALILGRTSSEQLLKNFNEFWTQEKAAKGQ